MKIEFIDLKKQYRVLSSEINAAISTVLQNASFINGSEVKELEEKLAEYCGCREVISCGNGTSSMEMILMAWGVGPGDAVFCPSFTFIATAEVVALRGAEPVFIDSDPLTFNIDCNDLEEKIKKVNKEGRLKAKAIISVDLFGLPADYTKLEKIAEEHSLFLLEDAAQGFGGRYKNRFACSFGHAASTSFFPAKPLGCYGDGGAVFTDDTDLADKIRSIRTHGAGDHKYEHVRIGQNSRLDTLQAAILGVKFKAFPDELRKRQIVASSYTEKLFSLVAAPVIPEDYYSAWAQYTIKVPAAKREKIISHMKSKGVPVMVYYPKPLHLQPAFNHIGGNHCLENSERLCAEVLSLPMHPYLTEEEIEHICNTLKEALK